MVRGARNPQYAQRPAPESRGRAAPAPWREPRPWRTHRGRANAYAGSHAHELDIDDDLPAEAQRIAGTATKRATVDYALRELVRRKRRRQALTLRGTVEWQGDLEESRSGRTG